ncbi:heme ABC transporter ATP-binding protein [Solimicrobium silvestre]|uniref:ABC-type hemin transport system ATPase component n=1 Tax=Solimicrobium silvestre TaxID=2099400 RepID=A0A2S9H0X3_9BURK|nr:heme ABC transporter ATP-binding protein [Solimicrobium silvestre]PRC93629.1 ABC-type hemin transport system ATPase component [Solimicrobium silvestre]
MLIADNIKVRIGTNTLLNKVSITIKPGELVAVLGPNGAGKSTLLKALSGERKPEHGSITLNQRPLQQWSSRELAYMRAVLPQESHLSFAFSVQDVVLFGRLPHCQGRMGGISRHDVSIAKLMMEKMGVSHMAQRDFTQLSGGEKSRVQLARVFAQIWEPWQDLPRYLMLDEPTAALDLPHQHYLLQAAKELCRDQAVGIVAILHDVNLAAQYADRIVYLKQGHALASGNVRSMLTADYIKSCFGIPNIVIDHPLTGVPVMLPAL